MKLAVDLHIHTALSPCAESEMTPNNIVNMAVLKGLDVIAITDHNTIGNYRAVAECANAKDIIVIPGMEIETIEEIHLVCLFPSIKVAEDMEELVLASLPQIENREEIFGQQLLMNEADEVLESKRQLLIVPCSLSIDEVSIKVNSLGGAVIPAHIDRSSYSIISSLGRIPQNLKFKYLEISQSCNESDFKNQLPYLNKYKFVKSSDAHKLGDILERESYLQVGEKSLKAVVNELK